MKVTPISMLLFTALILAVNVWAAGDGNNAPSPASRPAKALSPEQAKTLIQKLGDRDYKIREAAQKELSEAGPAVLGALAEAAASGDPEVKARAEACIQAIKAAAARAAGEELAKNYLWSLPMDGGAAPAGGPVVAAGRVYVTGLDRRLHVVDIKTGKEAWAVDVRIPAPLPQVDADDKVAVVVLAHELTVYDVRDGNQLWQASLVPANPTEPAAPGSNGQAWLMGDLVVGRIGADHLKAFKAQGGEVAWDMDCGAAAWTNFAIADGIASVVRSGSVAALDLAGQKELWSSDLPGVMSIAVGDKTFCYQTRDGRIVALDVRNKGQKLWEANIPPGHGRRMAFDDGRAYVSTGDMVTSWDLKTGQQAAAKLDLGAPADEGAANADAAGLRRYSTWWTVSQGTVYGAWADGAREPATPGRRSGMTVYAAGLFAFDAKTGERLWRLPLAGAPAGGGVVSDGVIYFATGSASNVMPPLEANAPPKDLPGLHALRLPARPGRPASGIPPAP